MLDAALRAGLNLPHSCKSGNCGACRARLLEGEVRYPNGRRSAFPRRRARRRARALVPGPGRDSDLIARDLRAGRARGSARQAPAGPHRAHRAAGATTWLAVYLKLPAAERFDFKPGQYLDVLLSKGRRRSFSIASPPHDARLLELHVRLAAGRRVHRAFIRRTAWRVRCSTSKARSDISSTASPREAQRRRAHAPGRRRHGIGAADEHPAARHGDGLGRAT